MRKWMIAGAIVAALVIGLVAAAQFAEEPLRQYAERASNEALPDYRVSIGALDLYPLTLSVGLRDVVVRQQANPEPTMANIERVRATARLWPLFAGRVGADLHVEKPLLAATGRQVEAFFKKGDVAEAKEEAVAWQDKVRDLLAFRVNLFVHDGEVTYEGPPLAEPVHLRGLEVAAEGLTNRPPGDEPYPARVRVDLHVWDDARVLIRGHADPLAKPTPAMEADAELHGLPIPSALKAVGKADVPVEAGVVEAAAHVVYGPSSRSVVVEHVTVREPRIDYVAPAPAVSAAPAVREAADAAPAWQDRVQDLFPITVRQAAIQNGTVAYRPREDAAPVRIERLDVTAANIQNRSVPEEPYPSDFRVAGVLPEDAQLAVQGRADFLAKPLPRMDVKLDLQRLHLGGIQPVAQQANVYASQGVLDLSGRMRYADGRADVTIDRLLLDGGKIDYVHTGATKGKGQARAKEGARRAQHAQQDPAVQVRVAHGQILHSEVGFVNKAASPDYRVFMADMNVEMDNLSTKPKEGTGAVKVTGKFMGTGPTVVSGYFRPEQPTPDFDLRIKIIKTKVSSLNNLLRAHGGIDTKEGTFAFFSELSVRDNHIEGYVKPLLRDVDVYDPQQDRNKGLAKRLYEAVVGGVLGVLENQPRNEVVTKGDVAGQVDNPQANTWEVVGNLVQNAFFKAILPGFEQGPVG
jgi:hypothetical protein